MIRRPPRSTPIKSSAASDVYKRQVLMTEEILAAELLSIIFSFVPYCGRSWLNIKLVSRSWKAISDDVFDPRQVDAVSRMIRLGNESAVLGFLGLTQFDVKGEILRLVCKNGKMSLLEKLISDGRIDPSINDHEAFIAACWNSRLDVIQRLLKDDRIDPSVQYNQCIRFASSSGNIDVVKLLLEHEKVDPSTDNNYCLRSASINGHFQVVSRLLEDQRVDPSAEHCIALVFADYYGQYDIVRKILQDQRVMDNVIEVE
eukprot:TRINITY_DN168_c0_g1_i2.p1 TRINITY_DN168_c0_g1~~TRINITY_DN168_c0_g1_i2.p1  ORF type:complete len:258 (+),score=55.84 TRINITY_DN168_c0_g1_i2:1-774(+)